MLHHILSALCLLISANVVCMASPTSFGQSGASIIQRVANVSTGNKACSTRYFPQPVHHQTFDGNWNGTATFLQQYQVIDIFYKPGGPILFYQSPEDPLTCLQDTVVYEWAKELGALAVTLEHRYFGLSCPYGLNYSHAATWTTAQMDNLTLENVLCDGASFLTWLTTGDDAIAKDAKVIVIGGSYGGFLSIMYRLYYPEIVYASLALSPVTRGLITSPNSPLAFAYTDWVNNVCNDLSAEAAAKINRSATDVRNRVAAGNFSGIQEALRLCSPPNSTAQAVQITGLLSDAYVIAAQYNMAIDGFPMNTIINKTLALNDSLSIVGTAVDFFLAYQHLPCANLNPPTYVRDPFDYIVCTYLPYPRTNYARVESIFGAFLPDFSVRNFNEERCQGMWGIPATDGGPAYQLQLGLDEGTLQSTTRLLISEGLYDPITPLGPRAWLPTVDRNDSRVTFVGQSGHGGEFLRPNASDPQAVMEARIYELNSMKEWLGMV